MKKSRSGNIFDFSITIVFIGFLIYAAYSLWYIFYGTKSGIDIHLYTVLSGSALGWFMTLFVKTVFRDAGIVKKLIAFFGGNAVFQGIIWIINFKINAEINGECYRNQEVVIAAFSVTFALSGVLLFASYLSKAKSGYKILNVILAIIFLTASCGGICYLNMDNIKAFEYKKNIKFDTVTSEKMALTENEQKFCETWCSDAFSGENGGYPFTFKVDGEKFNPADWDKQLTESPGFGTVYRGGQTEYIVLRNKKNGLEVTVESTVFENSSTCQWTVYIKNIGSANSGVISDFYALDSAFETGNAKLYYSIGSNTAASDFSLAEKNLTSFARKFSGTDGKPTEAYLPYFNIYSENYGMILGIGWTGQWASEMSEEKGITNINVKQENFEAYLLPGETVRSPLVSLSFYESDNPLKGFNLFRKWIVDCVYHENITRNSYTVIEVAGPMSTRTSDEIIEILDSLDKSVYNQTDAFWMDAGWYEYNNGWYDGVGNWTADKSRYDNGISELSGYAAEKGLGHVLWYEPERIYPGTQFHDIGSQNEEWLISVNGEDNLMWNLANEDAFAYYCDYLLKSLKENGVTIYRQDFNFSPEKYWEKADKEYYDGRTGICENHYVTNLYKFLDYLTDNIDGLIIDNCASGGKRLDLEMTYRSIPFWRSDYNCSYHPDLFDATQSHTYGISFWLPISGTALYMQDEYSGRSDIMPLMLMDFFSHQHPDFSFHKEQREMMTGNYYPLEFGGYDNDRMMAMQFSSEDALSGMALIYKRAEVKDNEYTVKLNGLTPSKTYNVYDIDNPEEIYTLTGEELMNDGITLGLPEGEKAFILMFNAQ